MAEHLLAQPDDYDYRLRSIMHTLPDKTAMPRWQALEFGDRQLYGSAVDAWVLGQPHCLNDITQKLCQSNMLFFITDHSMEPLELAGLWKNAVIIRFINSNRFQTMCLNLKTQDKNDSTVSRDQFNGNYCREKYNHLRGSDWPTWEEFDRHGYDLRQFVGLDPCIIEEMSEFYHLHLLENPVILFDVDSCYFDRDKFMHAIEQLYLGLRLMDFQPRLVETFYEKYMELHI
jgi:hypothetical protein